MRFFDRLMMRRRDVPRSAALPPRFSRRIARACRELTDAEQEVAEQLGLATPPRLLLVDEERGVVLTPAERIDLPMQDPASSRA